MTLLPLALSCMPATATPTPASGTCRFCGFGAAGSMRTTVHAGQPVAACLLCSLCHGLDRPRIADEAILVWLPEMTQRALVAVVRRLHGICCDHGEPPTMDRPPSAAGPKLFQARGVFLALLRRTATAKSRFGSACPSDLAAALAELPGDAETSSSLLGGLRLLPLGRFFDEDGTDIYPRTLADLPRQTGAVA